MLGVPVRMGERLARVKDSVTRECITLDVYRGTLSKRPRSGELAWVRPAELGELAMPAAHRRIADQLTTAPSG